MHTNGAQHSTRRGAIFVVMATAAVLAAIDKITFAANDDTPVLAVGLTMLAAAAIAFLVYWGYDSPMALSVLVATVTFLLNHMLLTHRYLTPFNAVVLFAEESMGWFPARSLGLGVLIVVSLLAFRRRGPWLYASAFAIVVGSWPSKVSDGLFI